MMERSKCIVQSCKRGCIEQASLMSAVKTSEVDSAWYHWLLKTCGETCGGINVDNSMFHVCSFHRRDKEQLEWGLCSTVDFVETLPVAKVTRAASMREHYSEYKKSRWFKIPGITEDEEGESSMMEIGQDVPSINIDHTDEAADNGNVAEVIGELLSDENAVKPEVVPAPKPAKARIPKPASIIIPFNPDPEPPSTSTPKTTPRSKIVALEDKKAVATAKIPSEENKKMLMNERLLAELKKKKNLNKVFAIKDKDGNIRRFKPVLASKRPIETEDTEGKESPARKLPKLPSHVTAKPVLLSKSTGKAIKIEASSEDEEESNVEEEAPADVSWKSASQPKARKCIMKFEPQSQMLGEEEAAPQIPEPEVILRPIDPVAVTTASPTFGRQLDEQIAIFRLVKDLQEEVRFLRGKKKRHKKGEKRPKPHIFEEPDIDNMIAAYLNPVKASKRKKIPTLKAPPKGCDRCLCQCKVEYLYPERVINHPDATPDHSGYTKGFVPGVSDIPYTAATPEEIEEYEKSRELSYRIAVGQQKMVSRTNNQMLIPLPRSYKYIRVEDFNKTVNYVNKMNGKKESVPMTFTSTHHSDVTPANTVMSKAAVCTKDKEIKRLEAENKKLTAQRDRAVQLFENTPASAIASGSGIGLTKRDFKKKAEFKNANVKQALLRVFTPAQTKILLKEINALEEEEERKAVEQNNATSENVNAANVTVKTEEAEAEAEADQSTATPTLTPQPPPMSAAAKRKARRSNIMRLPLENVSSIRDHPHYRKEMTDAEKETLKNQIKYFHRIVPHDMDWSLTDWTCRGWGDKDLENAYILRHLVSNRVFNYIRDKKWFPLPTLSALKQAIANGWRFDPNVKLPAPSEFQAIKESKSDLLERRITGNLTAVQRRVKEQMEAKGKKYLVGQEYLDYRRECMRKNNENSYNAPTPASEARRRARRLALRRKRLEGKAAKMRQEGVPEAVINKFIKTGVNPDGYERTGRDPTTGQFLKKTTTATPTSTPKRRPAVTATKKSSLKKKPKRKQQQHIDSTTSEDDDNEEEDVESMFATTAKEYDDLLDQAVATIQSTSAATTPRRTDVWQTVNVQAIAGPSHAYHQNAQIVYDEHGNPYQYVDHVPVTPTTVTSSPSPSKRTRSPNKKYSMSFSQF